MSNLLTPCMCDTAKKSKTVNGSRSLVVKRKSKKSKLSIARMGYKDQNGQIFLPPKQDEVAWKKKMQEKYRFE